MLCENGKVLFPWPGYWGALGGLATCHGGYKGIKVQMEIFNHDNTGKLVETGLTEIGIKSSFVRRNPIDSAVSK